MGRVLSAYWAYTVSRKRESSEVGTRRLLTRRSRFPDKGRVSAYYPFPIRITVLRLSSVSAAVRSTGCSSLCAALLARSEVKKAGSLPARSTTSHVRRRTARTRLRGFRTTARVVGIATHCARQHREHLGASRWGVGGAGGRGGEGRWEKVRGGGARGEPIEHETVGGGRGARRSARAQSATASRSVQGWGKESARARSARFPRGRFTVSQDLCVWGFLCETAFRGTGGVVAYVRIEFHVNPVHYHRAAC